MHGRLKEPKTSQGKRKIQLPPKTVEALVSQRGKDGFVFIELRSGHRWISDQPSRKRACVPAIKKSRVKHRECYHARHTFASQMLSQSKNHLWLATHLGHSDSGMIRKTYGRWIKEGKTYEY